MRLGVDEAGRGCLIGPMVVAGVVLREEAMERLRNAGVKDSKKLTRAQRERLFDLITTESDALAVAKAQPDEIDLHNLNSVTYLKVIQVIDSLSWLKPDMVTVDKVGKEIEVIRFIEELGLKSNVIHKADETFIEASAASVVAKVIRDRLIDSMKQTYGDFGSGYPSDRKTVKWIKELVEKGGDPPNIIRRTWKFLLKHAPSFYVEKVS
ncbi:ribonuclease HII [Metallosphaera hakonensis]|uniref:Ribonuclease HII n=1 Tax=Metallosphaera hakonensis JCM 8857 = DSM 7519 TaxID=1293036 RepID=A0A2U9IS55_9CREN|nr:ribonuclease HII [Metallosphaera hakonensis]AWR98835.1 ribonuclease HII [Metallosphaera hakonensis JCM 8857 = DSM 7519]